MTLINKVIQVRRTSEVNNDIKDFSERFKPKKDVTSKNISLPFSSVLELNRKYLFDEFKLDELIFAVTDKCPFRCKTCFYADTMDAKKEEDVYGMSLYEIEKISFSLGNFSKLLLTGGEPFLRRDIAELCAIFYHNNNVRHIHLPTNALKPKIIKENVEKILQYCPVINLGVSISIDGLHETHTEIRGVKESFGKLIETAHALGELREKYDNLRLNIITVVNNLNIAEINDLAEFVKKKLPVDSHSPIPVRGDPYDQYIRPPSKEEWDKISKELLDLQEHWNDKRDENFFKKKLRTNSEKHLYKVIGEVIAGDGLPFECKAGKTIGVLEANGDVRLCELKEVVGNVKNFDYDFKKVWFSERAEKVRKTVPGCSCTHPCFINNSRKVGLLPAVQTALGG